MGLNRIYKVIWSKTKGCYVVVSEMAKRVGRNKAKAIVMSTAAMAMAVAPAVMNVDRVEASVLIGATENDTTTATKINNQSSTVSPWGITIGGAISKAGDNSVHIGDATGSVGTRNVVIGTYATAGYDEKKPADNPAKDGSFNQSVAIGAGSAAGLGARAYGDQSIAIGSNTIARGNSSIAIGNDDVDKTETIMTTYTDLEGNRSTATIGTAYNKLTGKDLKWDGGQYADTSAGEAAVSIGVKAEAGDISLALGTAAKAKVVNGVAIGSGATADRDNAVAIGGGATTEKEGTKEINATIGDLNFTWKGGENTLAGDVVSFGKEGYERQLKNVAAGKVSANSTDAINGSQFFGILQHLTTDPVYFYGADDSTAGKIVGKNAEEKSADALKKKVVARSMADSRLDLKGGATGELTDNNIGVVYGDERTIKFKLAKELSGLTSAEFKDANNNVVNITPTGVSIKKSNATDANTVTLSQNGLNNGGNAITNVAGNLEGAKLNSTAPTTSATAPTLGTGPNEVNKNNVATVGDVLEAGWNLQNNSTEKDFVKPYDTVNFADGNGTTAVVDTTENKTSTVKYNVNVGNGLEKNSANQITIKPADTSLEVTKDGVKVKTDGTTITTDPTNGLKVVTGGIEAGTTPGTVKVTDGDNNKIATVDSVVDAVNNAAFTLKASAIEGGTRNTGSTVTATGESIKAGSTIEMIAGKNLEVTHNKNGKIAFATVDNPSFSTVRVGDSEGPKFSATADGNIRVSDKDDTNPVKITNVKDGEISKTSKDAINGSQFHKLANNTIKLAGQNGEEEATETDPQNLNQKDGIKFTVKSSDGTLLDVTAANDTITLAPKTGTITTTDGVPTAVTKNGKLVTVDEVVKALKDLGWKATAGTEGTGTMIGASATEELIKAGNTVTFKAGNNLSIKQDGKNFIYSLNPALTGLTSAEFKDGDNKVKITPTGITITKPAGTTENTVTLNQNGLNNGGNPITNVAGNLQGAKPNSTEPTTSATAPTLGTGADEVNKNNAATVGDVLNAGWNLQEKGVAKDFVKPYDTVNFIDGDGTSVAVATGNDGTTSTVKYSVNLGNGLEKTTDNKITVKPADTSLEVTTAGLKAKTDNTTITTGDSGLKVVTGGIKEDGNNPGTVKVTEGDTGKIATVDSVVDAVNSAAFTLKASAIEGGTRNTNSTVAETGESIKAGNTIEMIAGKNLNVTHNTNGKITFATVENPSFNTVKIGNSEGPKFSATADGNIKVSDKDDTKPVKITNVADGTISDSSKDAINGSQIHKLVNKAIKLAGQNGDDASGETEPQNLTQQDPIKFTVKSSDGKLLEVTAGGDTITLTPKTGTITTTDGVPTATTTNGKLVTADEVVKALKELGWKATAGTEGTGTMIGAAATEELIKAGNTVTFKAGDNLSIKQDGKNFIYSLKTDLKDLTSAEFKDANNNTVKITPNGVSFKKPNATDADTVTLNQNGLNNGGNPITNVAGNLQGAKAGTDAPTTSATAPSLGTGTDQVNKNNAATVGDVLNAGWNLQNNDAAKDFVKPYDTVNFVNGEGTTAVVETTDQTTSKIKYNVNTGKGLEKTTDNKITVKPGDKSLEVTDDGLKVKVDGTTIKTGDTGLTVNTGEINKVVTGDTAGTVTAKTGDEHKIATVGNVVEAINNAAWTATSAATAAGELGATETNQLVKAGDKVTFEADKNIKITQDAGKFTFATKDNVTFETVQVGGDQGPKFSKSAAGDIKVSGSDNTTPVKITNVKDGEISETSTDAINGSQFHKLANNTITLQGQTGDAEKSSTKAQNLDTKDGIKFTVKSSNGDLLEVTAAEDTITITPKTGTITTGADGIPTANTTGGKLVTADNLVNALTEMGWKATAGTDGTGTMIGASATEELIKAGNTVTFKAGDNLSIKQDGKNFIYSLNPALTGLTSAEFKDGKNNKVNITPEGITITKPADPTAGTPENTVTLNQNGLNNGGNPITNVGGNLDGAKAGTDAPTTKHDAPNTTEAGQPNYVNTHNAATVGDVLQAGWNLQNNSVEKDFVKPYDTVNFADGNGTTAVVDTTDNKISTVKYNVNLGNGLAKNDTNQITVKPADSSLVVDAAGVKVNTGTITNVTTGDTAGSVTSNTNDGNKLATVGNVVEAINNAAFTLKTSATAEGTRNANGTVPETGELIKAGNTVELVAGKNLDVKHDTNGKITFATKDNVTFTTVQVGGDQGPKFSKNDAGDIKVSGPNDTDPVKITNVKPGDISETSTDAINGSQFHGLAKNTIKLAGKTGDLEATETAAQDLDKKGGIKFTVKSSDGSLLEVAAEGDTITITPKTGTITTGANGIPTANTDGGKLVTADQLVTALTEMGWKATAGTDGTGTMIGAGATEELIKAGNTVTFKAGDNLSIKQDGKNFIYSLNPALTGLTSAEFKDGKNNKVNITPEGITITKPADPTAGTPENTVTLNQNGLNNGGNPITNVGGNLDGAKAGTDAPTTKHDAPNTTEAGQPNYVNTHNAATVGDVLQAGWNLQNNGAAKDFVKPYDTVNFVNGLNTTAVVSTVDGTTSHVTYNVTGLPVTYTTADGTPVSKIGDKFYKVNDKGQPIDEQGNPSTKVNNNGEPIDGNGNVINAIDTAANPLKTSLVNPAPEANKTGTTSPTTLDNVTSKLTNYRDPDVNGKAPVRNNLVDLSKPENGQPNVSDNTVATVGDLRNMGWIVSSNKTTDELTKEYSDTVKNANEVKFVGEGTAIVSGKTDDKGVRTITVKVDDQTSTNNSVTPIVYTKADGTQVYPTNKKDDQGHPIFNTKADGSGVEVPGTDVVTSVNGPNGTKGDKAPTTLKNVKNNIPNVNDGAKTITNPDGTEKAGDVENINKAPLTAAQAAELSNPKTADGAANPKYIGNNAATVSDVLNAGWNLQNNGTAKDFVKPYDTVNFINGLGTTAVVTTREDSTTSDVTFNVKAANGSVTVDEDGVKVTTGEMKPAVDANQKETGAIVTPVDPTTAKQLKDTLDAAVKELATAKDALKAAETALAAKPNDPALQKDVEDKKAQVAEKQTPVNNAQKAHDDAGLNKVATVQNVAEAINNSGFNLKTSADGGEKLTTGSKNDGELIKPGNTVEMVAGNNLTVKQDEHGKITYATKDDVTFKTVDTGTLNVGSPNTYTDGKGNTYTKVGENYYKPADVVNGAPKPDATPVDVTTTPVTPVSPVTMKTEAAKPATNNATDAQPSSALNVTSKDGKPTQITGVGSTLNTKTVDTTPTGTEPGTTPNTTPTNLVDLEGTADAPVNKNAAATVGDLQNMGWVVSTKDGNGYKDVVKNANVVDFKGDQGVTITGKTLADGTREITVGIKEGEVTNKVTITDANGTTTDAVKIGDNYYKVDEHGKPVGYEKGKDGRPAGTPLTIDPNTDTVTNNGSGFVTGNTVANAIQDSGWNVGKANASDVTQDFNKEAKVYDKINPNDDVKFVDGANTNVSMVTVDALNEDGTKKATTFVKVDINRDLKVDSVTTGGTAVDKNGNTLVKVGDTYYKEGDVTVVTNPDGTTTVTPKENVKPVPPADVIPAKDGAMIVKNADGKDVVSATVGKDGNGAFGINGKDGKNGISMTAKDGQGTIGVNGKDGKSTTIAGDTITIKDKDNNATNIGVNTITLVDKAGNTTTTTADKSEIKDAAGNINANTATGNTLKDPNGNTHTSTASTSELKDKDGNTNTSTPTTNVLKDTNGNTNTSAATGTTYKDKDENKTVVGPKEINISDKSGENTASLTNKDLLLNAKDPNTGVDKTSHVSGDKISFTTTDEMEKVVDKDGKPVIDPATGKQREVVKMEKVFDKDGKPVIDPATGKQKEVVKNPGNSTEYNNDGLKVIPNSTVARDVNGNPTFLDKDGKPVMKDTDGKYKYVGQDGKPGDKYDGAVGVLKPNVVDNTRVISFGMDKPVLDKNGKPVTGPDGNPVMTEGISAGMQQIHNVAPGTKDTDAVNVSQLRGTTININNRVNRVGAQAAALAGLQSIQYDPLEPTQISAGVGYYQGASALALGMNHYKNESTMFHVGASVNGNMNEVMANASVTWKFGARADETAVKDTFRQGPISASYTLQDKVSALEAQNQIQKDQLEELKALNAKQQEQIAELFKRLSEKA